ncbi:unnamed protein product, partial [Oncorhynchus mykiss]
NVFLSQLFEVVSKENGQLQSQLQDTQRTVSQTRLDLDKATQRQERFSDCSAMLEMEKKERRMLERRVAELEAELKVKIYNLTWVQIVSEIFQIHYLGLIEIAC